MGDQDFGYEVIDHGTSGQESAAGAKAAGAAGGGDGVGEEVGDPAGPGDQYRGTPPLRSKKPQRPRSHNITEQIQASEDPPPPLPPKRQSPAVASRAQANN